MCVGREIIFTLSVSSTLTLPLEENRLPTVKAPQAKLTVLTDEHRTWGTSDNTYDWYHAQKA